MKNIIGLLFVVIALMTTLHGKGVAMQSLEQYDKAVAYLEGLEPTDSGNNENSDPTISSLLNELDDDNNYDDYLKAVKDLKEMNELDDDDDDYDDNNYDDYFKAVKELKEMEMGVDPSIHGLLTSYYDQNQSEFEEKGLAFEAFKDNFNSLPQQSQVRAIDGIASSLYRQGNQETDFETYKEQVGATKFREDNTEFLDFMENAVRGMGNTINLFMLAALTILTLAAVTIMHAGVLAKEPRKAVRWYRKAAEQGDAVAQFNLGGMYDAGEGIAKDRREAVRWYHKAAEQGDAVAQFNLGLMYDNGKGIAKDRREAVRWYRKAAEQGYAVAQFNLGLMYDTGEGVITDYREAYIWYSIAKANGDKKAAKYLRKANWSKHLTTAEIKSARREAAQRLEEIDSRMEN